MCAQPRGHEVISLIVQGMHVREGVVSVEMTPEDGGGGRHMWTARVVIWMGSLATAALLIGVTQAHAGRPLVTDDAYPVELGRVEVEFGIELETSANSYSLTAPFSFGFGVTDWLEVAIKPSVLYQDDQEASPRRVAGVGDLVLEAKARLPFRPFDLDLALVPSLKIPTADEDRGLGTGKVDGGAVFVISKAFTDTRKLHFNVGYTAVGKDSDVQLQDQLFIGLAGETSIPGLAEERLQFVAEVFGTTAEQDGGPGDIQGHMGVRYLVGEDLILDAAIGRSFTARPQVEFFATVGLTWTFDAPWKRRKVP
jgi:Putative MetA-pathway of phenol degradation